MDMMMSQKEAKRGQVMELLLAGKIDQKEAGKMLAVSVRQIKRILRRYRTLGLPGLISKKRGRISNRRVDETIRTTAISNPRRRIAPVYRTIVGRTIGISRAVLALVGKGKAAGVVVDVVVAGAAAVDARRTSSGPMRASRKRRECQSLRMGRSR